ncbi:MAG TPA: hypothetical protein VF088_14015 [Pyrinomonadaceae bacterium]
MATRKANISSSHRAAHASLQTSLESYHEHLNQLHLQEAEIRQKKAIIKFAAANELTALKEVNLSAEAVAQRVALCW